MQKIFGSKLNTFLLLVLILLVVKLIFVLQNNNKGLDIQIKQEATKENVIDKTQSPIEAKNKEEILGNKNDLVAFSILPGSKVHGVVSYRGVLQSGYFFEANVIINIRDLNKKLLLQSNAIATTDWMISGPVSFEGNVDFRKLPKGPAYFEIKNDNPSGLPENDKSILIPIIIE